MTSLVKINAKGKPVTIGAKDWVAVYDESTGLMWPRADLGPLNHADASAAAAKLDLLGAKDWRLPTRKELLTLVDDTRHGPAIDVRYFPECKSDWYWTSTPAAWSPGDYAWFVGFFNGLSGVANRSGQYHVRAVRAGQLSGIGRSKSKANGRRR